MNPVSWFVFIVTSAITFALLYKQFFGAEGDFWECVEYYIKPDFFSWVDKYLQRDYGKSFKLSLFFIIVLGMGILAALVVQTVSSQ